MSNCHLHQERSKQTTSYVSSLQGVWWNPFVSSASFLWFPPAHRTFTSAQFRYRENPQPRCKPPQARGGPNQTCPGTHLPNPAVCCCSSVCPVPCSRFPRHSASAEVSASAAAALARLRHVARGFREVRQSRQDQHGTHVVRMHASACVCLHGTPHKPLGG